MYNVEQKLIEINLNENRRHLIYEVFDKLKQYRVVAKEIKGRKIRVSDNHWLSDFASCNYLGLDLDPEMALDIKTHIKRWGVHPSWCRLVASPDIYNKVEEKLAKLIGTEATLILPTVTLVSLGVLPALVGKTGVLLLDKSGHETMYEAAKIARDNGATLVSFAQDDFTKLTELLEKHQDNQRKVIMVDGVYSMSGDYAMVPKLVAIAKKYGALIYIDDAHGFGVVGENPDSSLPYGYKGNGIVKYFGLGYDNILYVGGCSKAYSSLAAFVGCSKGMRKFLEGVITPYDLSGPCPTASLATLFNGLMINDQRGDQNRRYLWGLTSKAINGLRNLGFRVANKTGFPIVTVHVGNTDDLIKTANILYAEGILVTVAPYPMVKKGEEAHRLTFTAANTTEEVEQLLFAFDKIRAYLK